MTAARPIPDLVTESRVRLPDGRDLGYAVFGAASPSDVVFWLHGTPGARRQIPLDARRYAAEAGIAVVGVDRPGVGWSTAHQYARVREFGRDLLALADELGAEKFHVVGLSGGGPYTLAAGVTAPERVRSLTVIGGVAPTVGLDAVSGGLVALARPLAPLVSRVQRPLGQALGRGISLVAPAGPLGINLYRVLQPAGDRRLLGEPDFQAMFLDDLINGASDGFSAALADVVLFTKHWGFDLSEVTSPVTWWHGDADHIVPLRHGKHVVRRLPDAQLRELPGEAHLGGLGAARRILEGLPREEPPAELAP